MTEAALAAPGVDGLLRAILLLLDGAPDSGLVIVTLGRFAPQEYPDALREKAALLLDRAERPDLAAAWRPLPEAGAPDNVVAFDRAQAVSSASTSVEGVTGPTLDDVGGLESVKAQVRRKIVNPFIDKGLFRTFRRKAGGGVLMYGPPGCGKTMLARALANECGAAFIEVRPGDVLDCWVGAAEKHIRDIFERARAQRPVVMFFDEVEALAQRRQFDATSKVNTTVSALLNEMDGFATDNEGILFLGATNVPWSLDGAFRRPGRFDRSIFVPPPDKVARRFILAKALEGRPGGEQVDLDRAIAATVGYSGADLAAVVETAVDIAIEESGRAGTLRPLTADHLNEALGEVRASTGEWLGEARNYARYANRDGLYDDLAAFLAKHGGR